LTGLQGRVKTLPYGIVAPTKDNFYNYVPISLYHILALPSSEIAVDRVIFCTYNERKNKAVAL
jgi:hypothetical protein